jgi:hypothetical protein
MNNKNLGIAPKTSNLPEEILTIFNECYSDFKNAYGEKHSERIKLLIESITDKVKMTDLYYTGPIASAHSQMGVVYTKSDKLSAVLKHEMWHVFNNSASGEKSFFYMPQHYKDVLEKSGYIKKLYEQTMQERKERFKDEPERLKYILVDYNTFLQDYTVDDHEVEKWTEWFNCKTNTKDMENSFWDWGNGFFTENLSSKSFYDSYINIADMISCLVPKEQLLEMYLQTDEYNTDYSYPQMIEEFDKKYLDALDEQEKTKYKYPYLKIIMDTKIISDNARKNPKEARNALQSCMKTCINAYCIKLKNLKDLDISSAQNLYNEIKYMQEHMMWNIDSTKMEGIEYVQSMRKVEEQFCNMLQSLNIETPEVKYMLDNVSFSNENKFEFVQNGEQISKNINLAQETPKSVIQNIGEYYINTTENGITDNLYSSLSSLFGDRKFNLLFKEFEGEDSNILIELSSRIEKATDKTDFINIYNDIYSLYAEKLENTLKMDENIDTLFSKYKNEIISLQKNALFLTGNKSYLPSLENVINIYKQKAAEYQEIIDGITEKKIAEEVQNRDVDEKQIRQWNENFANRYKKELQTRILEIDSERAFMTKFLTEKPKFSTTTLNGELTDVVSGVKISDFNQISQNVRNAERSDVQVINENVQLNIDED